MLWCGNSSRYRVYHSSYCLKHGDARSFHGQKAKGRNGNDDAEADALQVWFYSNCISIISHITLLLNRYQGQIGAALVLGGVDATGPQLFTIHPHGSTDKLPYVTMGSGSLAAMAVFEAGWKPNMEVRDHGSFFRALY